MATGSELITWLRTDILDDLEVPYLWSDATLLRYLNYAEVQACRRAHLLIDSSTTNDSGTAATASTAGQKALCQITLVAGQSVYSLNSKIIQVKRCQIIGMDYPLLGPLTHIELDERYSGWNGTSGTVGTAGTSGFPYAFMNEPTGSITFILAPGQSGTANLLVSRLPLLPFTSSSSPEIPDKYHEWLLNWAAHLAYLKDDSDTFNPEKAKYYEGKFIEQFGQLPSAKDERLIRTLSMQGRMRPRQFGY